MGIMFGISKQQIGKIRRAGRKRGGIIVGISKDLEVNGVREWKWALAIEAKRLKIEESLNIIEVYHCGKIKEILNNINDIRDEIAGMEERLLIIGDLNATIEEWQVEKKGKREKVGSHMTK